MPEDREREMMDDGRDGNIPGLPPFPEGMPEEMKQQLREAHENGGIGGMILGALLGRALRDPDEEMRQGIRRAMDLSPEETPPVSLRFALTSAVRKDGTEIMLASALLQSNNDEAALAESRDFLQKIVRPVLQPGEEVRVRMVDMTLGQIVERASETWNLPEFEEHVLLMQADSEFDARVAKFEQCQDCDDEDCNKRITERPTRDDADAPAE